MRLVLYLLVVLNFGCSFKSDENYGQKLTEERSNKPTSGVEIGSSDLEGESANKDTDGDFVKDVDEINLGRNPLVSDIPAYSLSFDQNFSIVLKLLNKKTNKEELFVIKKEVLESSYKYKYLTGNSLLEKELLYSIGERAVFDEQVFGLFQESFFNWIFYPSLEVDERTKFAFDVEKYLDESFYEILDIEISGNFYFDLNRNGYFDEVKDVKTNFYFKDYITNEYLQIYTMVDTNLIVKNGITKIPFKINNISLSWLTDNFLKRGELFAIGVDDYFIPSLNSTYKELINSVKEKTVPLVVITPIGESIKFISNAEHKYIHEFLNEIYNDQFNIAEGRVTKVAQFENNIPEYTDLSELRAGSKKGRWFVQTNKGVDDYLNIEYSNGDLVILSYFTGEILSKIVKNTHSSNSKNLRSNFNDEYFPLGKINKNGSYVLSIKPNMIWGDKNLFREDIIYPTPTGCSRNCYSIEFKCTYHVNTISFFQEKYAFINDSILERIFLSDGKIKLNLKNMIEEKKVRITKNNDQLNLYLSNINDLFENDSPDEFGIMLSSENDIVAEGITFFRIEGKDQGYCIYIGINAAIKNKWPLNTKSTNFTEWENIVDWNKVQKGNMKTVSKHFSIRLQSRYIEYFN